MARPPDNKLSTLKSRMKNDAKFMRTMKIVRIKKLFALLLRKLGLV